MPEERPNVILYGIGVYSGIAIGKPYFIEHPYKDVVRREIRKEQIPAELERFRNAIEISKAQLEEIKQQYGRMLREKDIIFDAHIFLIEDETIIREVREFITNEKVNAEYALIKIKEKFQNIFREMEDEYLKDRGNDIGYVTNRILKNLMGKQENEFVGIKEPGIVIAHDLCPSETAKLKRSMIKGFAIEVGGPTSHTAILSRSLKIPAVVGIKELGKYDGTFDYVIVDGNEGMVILNPTQEQIDRSLIKQKKMQKLEEEFDKLASIPARTKDGHYIQLKCNIDRVDEIDDMIRYGAEGIGLFRSEYIYLEKSTPPSEDEHFEIYRKVVERAKPYQVTIRTFDLGGDKFITETSYPEELNPFLGIRGIRLSFKYPDLFLSQLKAIMRASAHGRVQIMFPLISGIEEVKKAKEYVYMAQQQLEERNIRFDPNIPIGIMIELPTAVMISDLLAKEVNFFSIGTNDLIQYSLGIDRVNQDVSYLYQPLHPGILRMIERVLLNGKRNRIDVSLCGEMSSDPLGIVILTAMGFRELSMNPSSIPVAKTIIRHFTKDLAENLMSEIYKQNSYKQINNIVLNWINDNVPVIMDVIPH